MYFLYQLEQLIAKYKKVAETKNELGEYAVKKSLSDHLSKLSSKYILEADVSDTGIVDHYLNYGIRKVNGW